MAQLPEFASPQFIAIEGPIRVGKTSLADILAAKLGATRLCDFEDNPFLDGFYKDQPGSAFKVQMYFLLRRYQQLMSLDLAGNRHQTVVGDYLFEKDKIFAYMNLGDAELGLYNAYFELFDEQVPLPDLVIYLQANAETLRRRIARRNLPREREISDEYLEEVIKAYEHFFFHYKKSNLLVVNTSEIDFVGRNEDREELLRRLRQPVQGTQYYLPLGSAGAD
ncbi:MAG: deoxynucleoside kinase [Acidobacteria bacterium]|nr:deoxynucleoside kinase [Acidobacteriota bacterium]